MLIEVTQRDIDKGVRADFSFCPIARAIKRKTHKVVTVTRFLCTIGVKEYCLPIKVEKFIGYFDSGYEVRPFSFEIGKKFNLFT